MRQDACDPWHVNQRGLPEAALALQLVQHVHLCLDSRHDVIIVHSANNIWISNNYFAVNSLKRSVQQGKATSSCWYQ